MSQLRMIITRAQISFRLHLSLDAIHWNCRRNVIAADVRTVLKVGRQTNHAFVNASAGKLRLPRLVVVVKAAEYVLAHILFSEMDDKKRVATASTNAKETSFVASLN